MTEKHLALRDKIGTYGEEDKAYNLLTWLISSLPSSTPGRSSCKRSVGIISPKMILQEPEMWGPEGEEESLLAKVS